MSQPYVIRGSLTREIDNTSSPVRQFLDERFASGLKDVQRAFREAKPPVVVASAPQAEANPGTVGGAADWLLRFMVCPDPSADLAVAGASHLGSGMQIAVAEVARMLGARVSFRGGAGFAGPVAGSSVDEELLARGCWALALATEAFRSAQAAFMGPLARLTGPVTADGLLSLVPPGGLSQLDGFRRVFETTLIPQLAERIGQWTLGPVFAGSTLLAGADGDLIAAGLLLDLKTSAKLTLAVKDLWQVIGYALLDFEDDYHLDSIGIFSARYAHLVTWDLVDLLGRLSGSESDLHAIRGEFRKLLITHSG